MLVLKIRRTPRYRRTDELVPYTNLFRYPYESEWGDYGIYDINSWSITLKGSVSLNRGDTEVRGQRLVMDRKTGRSTLDGGNVASPDGGRVSGRFVVPQRSGD